jgi:Fe-S cluster assembly ATP-binding protein
MLSIKDLSLKLDQKSILTDLNLTILPGQVHVVMGSNGSGKSSLLNFLAGRVELQMMSGQIDINQNSFYNGKNINLRVSKLTDLEPDVRSKIGIFLAQQHPVDLVGIAPVTFLKTIYNYHQLFKSQPELDSLEFLSLLNQIQTDYNLNKNLTQRKYLEGMSGGEKKNFELLQMLLLKPKLIMLDEIDSGLDVDSIKNFASIINKFKSLDRSWLIVTHNPVILDYFEYDFVHLLNHGAIIKSGKEALAKQISEHGFN